MLVFGTARAGSFENAGVGAHVVAHMAGLAALSGELEVGGLEKPSYVLRGMVGLLVRANRASVTVSSGVATTRFGDDVPAAIDIPLELRVRLPIGSVRAHAWTRIAIIQDQGPRDRPDPWDELSAGVGASVPMFGRRVLFGIAVEDRAMGSNALFSVGVPLRQYF